MILLHGFFDLRPNVDEDRFRAAFHAFYDHLRIEGLVTSARFMRREPHSGYDSTPPETQFYTAIEFRDMAQAERCWAYLEVNAEPVRSLHITMNRLIRSARFFLSRDIET